MLFFASKTPVPPRLAVCGSLAGEGCRRQHALAQQKCSRLSSFNRLGMESSVRIEVMYQHRYCQNRYQEVRLKAIEENEQLSKREARRVWAGGRAGGQVGERAGERVGERASELAGWRASERVVLRTPPLLLLPPLLLPPLLLRLTQNVLANTRKFSRII